MNKEEIKKKESVRDFFNREIKDTRSIVKELSEITILGMLTDARGDFAEFYVRDIEKVLEKVLSDQKKELVEEIEKYNKTLSENLGCSKELDTAFPAIEKVFKEIFKIIKDDH